MTTWNVASISDLESLSPSVGDAAIVAGYYAPGDLGGGVFYWEGTAPECPKVVETAPANAESVDATGRLCVQYSVDLLQ